MPELLDSNNIVKTIAFYLPQFHTIPENDKAWGKGFTEWTNVKKAQPLFEGHYQPRVPYESNYYCLEDVNVMREQAALAKRYGIFGFCYYHYWFKNGKKLLEKPVENMLKDYSVDIPFCLSWANENWSKRWDGGNKELIAEQDYGDEKDWESHLQYLLPFFKDPRYIKINGKPIFLIYKPEEIERLEEMLDYFNNRVKNYGIDSICFMVQGPWWYYGKNQKNALFDYQIKFCPHFAMKYQESQASWMTKFKRVIASVPVVGKIAVSIAHQVNRSSNEPKQLRLNYDDVWRTTISTPVGRKIIEGAFVDWDNTARNKHGMMMLGANPEKFYLYMTKLIKKIRKNDILPVIFINAWNEWAEGAYLEPDEKYGYQYLEALSRALNEQ